MKLDGDHLQNARDPALLDEVQRVLGRLERAAWLWRGRRHSMPGDQDPEIEPRLLALVAPPEP